MFDNVGSIETRGQNAVRAAEPVSAPAMKALTPVADDVTTKPLSPRMKADAEAGVIIMEYLSEKGDAKLQVPSQTVVAYLRSGLTSEGLPNKEAAQPSATMMHETEA